ncbi:MAG TPA: hypothetical protein VFR51_05730, partial [Pyrinomonadaceae bacterium]|nr:hypothetical protein [Pyrinomonadaceae bacterium]
MKLSLIVVLSCVLASAQTPTPTPTPSDAQHFTKGGLVFDYPNGWTISDISDDDAQQYTLSKSNSDLQMRVFAHKGRVTQEKLAEAKKSFIEPYVKAVSNQFRAMGATPSETADTTEIAGLPADGVKIAASLGGDPGAAKIYWVLLGQRVVVLTLFGPDREIKQFTPAWDLFRKSLKIEDPKAAASPPK